MTNLNEVWDETFTRMWNAEVIPNPLDRIMISGYSRTGKSTLIKQLTKGENITFYKRMPLEDLIGGMCLIDGSTKWVDGPATRALRHGKVLHIDEMNELPDECVTIVYALMDKPAGIMLPTGERVEAAPGYAVIATMNPTPDCLPHPIYDRFDVFLKANTLSAGVKAALGPKLAEKAQNVIGHNQPAIESWNRPVTVNGLLAFAKLRKIGVTDTEAAFMLGFRGPHLKDLLTVVAER